MTERVIEKLHSYNENAKPTKSQHSFINESKQYAPIFRFSVLLENLLVPGQREEEEEGGEATRKRRRGELAPTGL